MSILTITPNLEKKTAKFRGTVAAGEHVSVSIENASEISTLGLRLRVIDYSGNTLAMFPEPSLEEGMDGVGGWGGDGFVLTCELSLNTAPMHKAVCGMCEREFTVVLDNVAEKELHFVGQHTFQGWPKREGEDIPYDLEEYPDVVEDLKTRVNEAESAVLKAQSDIADAVNEATGIVKTAWEAKREAEQAVEVAVDAKNVAVEKAEHLTEAVERAEIAESGAITAAHDALVAKNEMENVLEEMEDIRDGFLDSCYTKEEVNSLIDGAKGKRIIVQELPAVGEDNNIYMVEKSGGNDKDWYDEYMWIDGRWERIGSTNVNANSFATKEELNAVGRIAQGASDGASAALGEVNKLQKTVEQKRDKTDNIAAALSYSSKWDVSYKIYSDSEELKAKLELWFRNTPTSISGSDSEGWNWNNLPTIEGYYEEDRSEIEGAYTYISYVSDTDLYGFSIIGKRPVVVTPDEPYVTPTGVKNIAIPKYEFADTTPWDGTRIVLLKSSKILNVDLMGLDGFAIEFEEGDGKARDCVMVVDLTSLGTAPTITWGENFHPRTDADTDFACEAGKRNVYWITEYAPGEFCVAGWQETTGGNAQ